MIWIELLGTKIWQLGYIKVAAEIKAAALGELSGEYDVILHREGKRSRFIRQSNMA